MRILLVEVELGLLAQPDPNQTTQVRLPVGLQYAIQLVPLLALFFGLPFVSRLGKKSGAENRREALDIERAKLETEKLRIELQQLRGEPEDLGRHESIEQELAKVQQRLESYRSQMDPTGEDRTRTLANLEGYIVRYLLLYFSFVVWGIIESLLSRFFFDSFYYERIISLFLILGNILIFAVLGIPLLRDIIRATGYRVRNPLKR